MALKRFIERRGRPQRIYSHNGTNFVGANKELLRCLKHQRRLNGSFNRQVHPTSVACGSGWCSVQRKP